MKRLAPRQPLQERLITCRPDAPNEPSRLSQFEAALQRTPRRAARRMSVCRTCTVEAPAPAYSGAGRFVAPGRTAGRSRRTGQQLRLRGNGAKVSWTIQ